LSAREKREARRSVSRNFFSMAVTLCPVSIAVELATARTMAAWLGSLGVRGLADMSVILARRLKGSFYRVHGHEGSNCNSNCPCRRRQPLPRMS
jgi:hypothetical protein